MARRTMNEIKERRLAEMTVQERSEFDATYEAAQLALRVGEKIRDAREAGTPGRHEAEWPRR